MAKWVQVSEQLGWFNLDMVTRITQETPTLMRLWYGMGEQDSFVACSGEYAEALTAYLRKEGAWPAPRRKVEAH